MSAIIDGRDLGVTTNLTSGLQTVTDRNRMHVSPPCCTSPLAALTRTVSDPVHTVSFGRPGIGNVEHPFRCSQCDTGYVIKPVEGGRELVVVTA